MAHMPIAAAFYLIGAQRRKECVGKMLKLIIVASAHNCDDIELDIDIQVIVIDISICSPYKIVLLLDIDSHQRVDKIVGTSLYLDNHKPAVDFGHNVDFHLIATPIGFPDCIPLGYQIFCGNLFAPTAGIVMLCHNAFPLISSVIVKVVKIRQIRTSATTI